VSRYQQLSGRFLFGRDINSSSLLTYAATFSTNVASSTSTTKLIDGRVPERLTSYTKYWDADASKDSAEHTANRVEHAQSLAASYYDGATELYEYAWAQSFHFSRFYKGEGFKEAVREASQAYPERIY